MAVKRRQSREWAVQFLFQHDFNARELEESLREFWEDKTPDTASKTFTEILIRGVLEYQKDIDRVLCEHVKNWDMARIGAVERNAMRIALFEMMHQPDIPSVVSINEAVAISKVLAEPASGRFVNGILDRIRSQIRPNEISTRPQRPGKEPS